MIPAGSTSATFSVTTSTVSSSTDVMISAVYGGTTQNATLSVTPPPVTTLSATSTGKSGPPSARVWSYKIANSGPSAANAAQITSLTLTQTGGPTCTSQPVVGMASVSGGSAQAFPVQLGDLSPASSIPVNITINFSSCKQSAHFTAALGLSANGGATTTSVVRYNQLP
jgi:hypothetical protein